MSANNKKMKKESFGQLFSRYTSLSSSLYGRVIYIISILSIFLFVTFGIIFRSVNERYMKSVIHQCGYRVAFLVEGSLYHSMLLNDKTLLQNTLDQLNNMPGIDAVHMYDNNQNLMYSSLPSDSILETDANCHVCHSNFDDFFDRKIKSSKILAKKGDCQMNKNGNSNRQLFINSPILNEETCYTNDCHHHSADEEVLGSLMIKVPLKEMDIAIEESTTDFFLLATITTLLLLSFLILFTRNRIQNPLKEIIRASERVANGNLDTRLELKYNELDDIRKVSLAFNNMLDNLHSATIELQNWSQQLEYKVQKKSEELKEAHNELVHIERMASLGKLSSSVAHEINNPLTGVLTYTKLIQKILNKQLKESQNKESIIKYLGIVEDETKRCGEIVKGLLDFSRKDQQNFEPKELNLILRETYELMTHSMKMVNVNFVKNLNAKTDIIYCSPNQIKQACVAILQNAKEAIFENGEILLETNNPDNDSIKLEIIDNGAGIAEEDIPHIFEPFFSAKENKSGTGLGLAIVHGIVQNHHGKIDVKSTQGSGTTIAITLPLFKQKDNQNVKEHLNSNS
jgi:two-component system, NtrC family, sensor kinase